MTTITQTRAFGRPVQRVDGHAKVTGSAYYSAEISLPDLACAELVWATAPVGKVTCIDTAEAQRADGVLAVMTHRNIGELNPIPLLPSILGGPAPGETCFPMQDETVHYAPVAIVIADSLERAQHAASLVDVHYAENASVTTIAQGDPYEPEKIFGGLTPGRIERGGTS